MPTNRFLEFLEASLALRYTLKTVHRPIFIWRGTSRDFVAHLTASQPKKLAPLAKKLIKLVFTVVSMVLQELFHLLAIFRDCSSSPCRSLLISKPTLCKTILSSSFVLESCTKTDKFFSFFGSIHFQNPGKNSEYYTCRPQFLSNCIMLDWFNSDMRIKYDRICQQSIKIISLEKTFAPA